MEQVTLRADKRETSGTRPARRLRREGLVPAVVYGKDLDTMSVTVDSRDLYGVLHTEAGLNALIKVEVDGAEDVLAVARELQRHPVRGDVTHLDLIQVSLTEAIEAEVGIEYTGVPAGVREEGGFVETIGTSVMIEALITQIPSSIELDITALDIGDSLKVADLPQLEGVTYLDDEDRPLVTVLAPRLEEEVEEEVEGEEGELLEGEEPEEGEETPSDEEA
jgi:large subunit ribosomal protein L25